MQLKMVKLTGGTHHLVSDEEIWVNSDNVAYIRAFSPDRATSEIVFTGGATIRGVVGGPGDVGQQLEETP